MLKGFIGYGKNPHKIEIHKDRLTKGPSASAVLILSPRIATVNIIIETWFPHSGHQEPKVVITADWTAEYFIFAVMPPGGLSASPQFPELR